MQTIRDALREKKLLVSDGAWGTMLMAAGLPPNVCSELWNVENPDAVRNVGAQYIAAGSELITTNSFGGTSFKLGDYGQGARVREFNRAAASISREAAGNDHFVIGSMGPTGKFLLMGDVTERELYDAFRAQAEALAEGGANACCIETMSAIDEAVLAVKAAKENTDLEVICTFTFDRVVDGVHRTMMGVSPAEMAAAIVDAGADIIGSNCSQGPSTMVGIVEALHAAAPDTPIVVHPNAGIPAFVDDAAQYPETPESMAAYVPALVRAGASIIGGCCGTTPGHIREIAATVRSARRESPR
ncbi:MAG: homocysteine S-methyltransferase family protein [Candidatus Hydrogenedentes bacterium]|nr:homocysteine S-methyltransferase family protein [Candidatus Hydrogenedentota bacterium]